MKTVIAILAFVAIGGGTLLFVMWFNFGYLAKAVDEEYEPDQATEHSVIGKILGGEVCRRGAGNIKGQLFFPYIYHLYLLVEEVSSKRKIPVLVHPRYKQFRGVTEDIRIGECVEITGGYLKRAFPNDVAVKFLEAADPIDVDIEMKVARKDLRALGVTAPYHVLAHPFGAGLEKGSPKLEEPVGTMLVAHSMKPCPGSDT